MQTAQPIIGKGIDRVDGRLKVTGGAKYAAEFDLKNLAHAVAFHSTIARGRVTSMDTLAAGRAPGVLAVITRKNAPKLKHLTRDMKNLTGQPGQTMALLQNDEVHYYGQFLGLVVADTFEHARDAAGLVKIEYKAQTHTI